MIGAVEAAWIFVVVLMVVVVVKQAQEHHGEEHENEGLQEGHKQFQEVEGEARGGTNNRSDFWASQILQDTQAKTKQGGHHGVPRHSVQRPVDAKNEALLNHGSVGRERG